MYRVGLLLTVFAMSMLVSGCYMMPRRSSGDNMSAFAAIRQQIESSRMGYTQNQQVPSQELETISEDQLSEKLNGLPELTTDITIERKKDGFSINGMRHVDPEGKIVAYGFDVLSGDITYLTQNSRSRYSIKFLRALSGQEPILLGVAQKDGPYWKITTVTGRDLSGNSFTPLSKGFLVSRDTAGFVYRAGEGISSFGAPDGFHVASFQNGEVEKTGYVLLERDEIPESNKFGSLIDSAKSLGSSLGLNKKEDYVLFNVKTGQQAAINISASGKDIAIHTGCRQAKGKFIRKCENVDFVETLYDQYGNPNGTHYFWRLSWFQGDEGTVLVTEEGTKVIAKNIDTNSETVIFKRMMGINHIMAERLCNGKICVRAKMGFSTEENLDVESSIGSATNNS